MQKEQAEPQNYTLKTRVEITQSLPRNTASIWQIKENAPTSSPILTVKTAGPAWARRTLLKVQLSS